MREKLAVGSAAPMPLGEKRFAVGLELPPEVVAVAEAYAPLLLREAQLAAVELVAPWADDNLASPPVECVVADATRETDVVCYCLCHNDLFFPFAKLVLFFSPRAPAFLPLPLRSFRDR